MIFRDRWRDANGGMKNPASRERLAKDALPVDAETGTDELERVEPREIEEQLDALLAESGSIEFEDFERGKLAEAP
jgi:hypothetical protein